jgi:peptidoglycan hydrolase-like protein with peptidoglycan-binding domain
MAGPFRPAAAGVVPRRPLAATLVVLVLLALALAGVGAQPAQASTGSAVREAQTLLRQHGYPVGAVDGIDGPRTRQGLCAWRRLSGLTTSRGPLTTAELQALRTTTGLPRATVGRGVTVDRTCQVVYYRNDGRWQKVLPASTGAGGTLPRNGDYRIQRTRAGWHTSSRYPSPTPNMYNTLYFDGAIAIHGARQVPTYPASKGCVRVTPRGADWLFARMRVGDPVRVIGRY